MLRVATNNVNPNVVSRQHFPNSYHHFFSFATLRHCGECLWRLCLSRVLALTRASECTL